MRLGILAVEIDRFAIQSLGVRRAILPRADDAQIVVRLGVPGIELDRHVVATRGLVVAPEALENLSQIIPANRRVGPQSHGTLHEREGDLEVPRLQRDHAEQIQRVRVLGFELEYCTIALLRLGQTAGSMVLEREREGSICALLWHRVARRARGARQRTRSTWM